MDQKNYHGIQLADGEEIVRDYHAAVQKRPKINIYVAVTTRRLLSAGESKGVGGKSAFMSEVYIQNISGIRAFYGGGIDLIMLIVGLFLTIIGGVISFEVPFIGIYIGILLILVGLYYLFSSLMRRGKAVSLEVFSKDATGVPISIGATSTRLGPTLTSLGLSSYLRLGRRTYLKPGPDSERMVRELSACVMDLQSDRENALKKWSTAVSTPTQVEQE
jgi:hypothetical protein